MNAFNGMTNDQVIAALKRMTQRESVHPTRHCQPVRLFRPQFYKIAMRKWPNVRRWVRIDYAIEWHRFSLDLVCLTCPRASVFDMWSSAGPQVSDKPYSRVTLMREPLEVEGWLQFAYFAGVCSRCGIGYWF